MSDYYSLPTTLGAAKLAAAANNNQALTLSHMAFGDANGIPYLPTSRVNATNLVNERYRVAVQFVVQDTQNPNVYIIKARIPANIGGFDVNEIGIFDTEGELIYLANYPRTFKPQITQGAGGELNVKIHIMTSHSSVLALVLNPNVITLTQENGDGRYALKTELDAEAIARENADLALSIALSAEITARENSELRILKRAWPIGSVYENEVDLRNPAHEDLLGFGTWIPTQDGRFSVGYADADLQFGGLGWAGGNRNHKMTSANLISHYHDRNEDGLEESTNVDTSGTEAGSFSPGANYLKKYTKTSNAGQEDPEPIPTLPPYVVSAKWRRTA